MTVMKAKHSIMHKLLFTMLTNSLLFLLCVGVCLVTIYKIHSDLLVVKEKGQRSVGVTDLSRMVNEKDIRIADYITFMKEEDLKESTHHCPAGCPIRLYPCQGCPVYHMGLPHDAIKHST